jgi:hypothetical protein
MSESQPGWAPPVIDSYSVEKSPPLSAAELAQGYPQPLARVILRGRNFFIRAVTPKVAIGGMKVLDFQILPDESTIILHLFERPPENGTITVSYGPSLVAELGPFTWDTGV